MVTTPRHPEAAQIAEPLLAYLQKQLGPCEFAEWPRALVPGNETSVYAFRLAGLAPPLDNSMVLRLFHPGAGEGARIEAVLQNAIAAQGLAVARAFAVCEDESILGAPFFAMERLPGSPLYADSIGLDADDGTVALKLGGLLRNGVRLLTDMPRTLARIDLQIAELDASKLQSAFDDAQLDLRRSTLAGLLDRIANDVDTHPLGGHRDAVLWLRVALAHSDREVVLCHGDMQPLNLLARGGEITGVVDWSNAIFAPPEYQVGATRATLLTVPIPLPAALGWTKRLIVTRIADTYTEHYAAGRPIDVDGVRAFEALRCFAIVVEMTRRVASGETVRDAWNSSEALERVAVHFAAISGVEIAVPEY